MNGQPGLRRRWARWRDRLRDRPIADGVYRTAVGVLGLAVLVVGIVAIPYPGPGWVILFAGLGILATEFRWAARLLRFMKVRYGVVTVWFGRQGRWVQVAGVLFTSAVVLTSLWLLGILGWAAGVIGLDWAPLHSPIGLGT